MASLFKLIKHLITSVGYYLPFLKSSSEFLNNILDKSEKKILFLNKNHIKYPITNKSMLILEKDSHLTDLILKDFEFEERFLLPKLLKKNGHFFDIGASIGLYSIVAGESIINGKIFAFEPCNISSKKLQKNIILNNYKNIEIINYAATNNDNDNQKIFINKNGFDAFNSMIAPISNDFDEELVQTIRLDTFAKMYNIKIEDIQFIKIDVEGMEFEALDGARELLKNGEHIIFMIEFNHDFRIGDTSCNKVYKLLKENNFECFYYTHEQKKLINIEHFKDSITGNFFCFHKNQLHLIQNYLATFKITTLN